MLNLIFAFKMSSLKLYAWNIGIYDCWSLCSLYTTVWRWWCNKIAYTLNSTIPSRSLRLHNIIRHVVTFCRPFFFCFLPQNVQYTYYVWFHCILAYMICVSNAIRQTKYRNSQTTQIAINQHWNIKMANKSI